MKPPLVVRSSAIHLNDLGRANIEGMTYTQTARSMIRACFYMSKTMNKLISTSLPIALGLTLLSSASFAGPFSGMHPLQSDRFNIGLGGYGPDISGYFSIDDPDGSDGDEIDVDDDSGLDDDDILPAVALTWRLSNKLRIQGEYFTVGQSATKKATKTIDIGDLEFPVGASLNTDFDVDIGRAFLGYSFIKNDTMELGAGLGAHYLGLDISVKGKLHIGDHIDIDVPRVARSIDDWAILPNIGGYANYAFSPKWLVSGRLDWISANIGDYDGTLWNVEGHIQYQITDHFGAGLAYRYLDLELAGKDTSRGDWDTRLEYSGPLLFVTANF